MNELVSKLGPHPGPRVLTPDGFHVRHDVAEEVYRMGGWTQIAFEDGVTSGSSPPTGQAKMWLREAYFKIKAVIEQITRLVKDKASEVDQATAEICSWARDMAASATTEQWYLVRSAWRSTISRSRRWLGRNFTLVATSSKRTYVSSAASRSRPCSRQRPRRWRGSSTVAWSWTRSLEAHPADGAALV